MPKIKNSFLEEGVIFDFRAFVSLIYPAFRGDPENDNERTETVAQKKESISGSGHCLLLYFRSTHMFLLTSVRASLNDGKKKGRMM